MRLAIKLAVSIVFYGGLAGCAQEGPRWAVDQTLQQSVDQVLVGSCQRMDALESYPESVIAGSAFDHVDPAYIERVRRAAAVSEHLFWQRDDEFDQDTFARLLEWMGCNYHGDFSGKVRIAWHNESERYLQYSEYARHVAFIVREILERSRIEQEHQWDLSTPLVDVEAEWNQAHRIPSAPSMRIAFKRWPFEIADADNASLTYVKSIPEAEIDFYAFEGFVPDRYDVVLGWLAEQFNAIRRLSIQGAGINEMISRPPQVFHEGPDIREIPDATVQQYQQAAEHLIANVAYALANLLPFGYEGGSWGVSYILIQQARSRLLFDWMDWVEIERKSNGLDLYLMYAIHSPEQARELVQAWQRGWFDEAFSDPTLSRDLWRYAR